MTNNLPSCSTSEGYSSPFKSRDYIKSITSQHFTYEEGQHGARHKSGEIYTILDHAGNERYLAISAMEFKELPCWTKQGAEFWLGLIAKRVLSQAMHEPDPEAIYAKLCAQANSTTCHP